MKGDSSFWIHYLCLQADLFVVKGTEIGDLERIVISHDNSGVGSSWHCQQVGISIQVFRLHVDFLNRFMEA
jgi:hypothetical protein